MEADLLIVGGGFTGLWSALRAVERAPGRRVVLVEADRVAGQATGRNGGFCEASLTHGLENGRRRWPDESALLERLGNENLAGIEATVERYGIDCGFMRGCSLTVATRSHEVAALGPTEPGFLDEQAVRAIVDSPTYLAGRLDCGGSALVDPARLAWGLAAAAEGQGVRIAEGSPVRRIRREGTGLVAETATATIRARRVVIATNAFPSLVRGVRLWTIPVYDYVLATEPLSPEQRAALRWDPSVGISDAGNRFHYYRITQDGRIVWGGYDAIYHYGRSIREEHFEREASFVLLARHFGETFPQLRGLRFSHRWAGVIDTSTRFSAFFGTAHGGRSAYAAGFTGLGVGASRFAADVLLDLLSGDRTERTELAMVRHRGVPFPPEPLVWPAVRLTQWALAREDRTGRRGIWLRLLDALGLGFDS